MRVVCFFSGYTDTMTSLLVHCDRHWEDNQFMGPISFACFLTNKEKDTYSELSEIIFDRIGVNSDRFNIRISSKLKTKNGICTLSIKTDADVTCLLTLQQSDFHEVNVKVVEISVPENANVFKTPKELINTTIPSPCTPSGLKPTSDPQSEDGTPHFKSVSGSNKPFGSVPSPGISSTEKDHGTPASTNKHAEVDNTIGSNTSDTEDESGTDGDTSDDRNGVSEVPQCGGQAELGATDAPTDGEEERGVSGAPNSYGPCMTSRWRIPGSELYSIQPVQSKDLFENQGDKGDQGDQCPIYKGQIFKNKKTLKLTLGLYAFENRFEYKIRRSSHSRFAATCIKGDCESVITAGKLKTGTYWHVKSFVKEHTCGDSGNYNVDFKRVSSYVIGELYARKVADPGCTLRPKDIMFEMKDQHGINLSYNKAHRSKDRALHSAFGDPLESFQMLPAFFYMLEQSNPGTVTKIETDSENRFTYGFLALGACVEGFNTVIRPVIAIDATHLKGKTRGVLLVAVCKDGNEMIYPLAFGFANSESTESWTWFLKRLREVILCPERVMIVSDRHAGIFAGMEASFPDAAHGVCAYHLSQNLKRICKQRDDVIKLYYHAAYVYRVDEFEREMAELKAIHRKVYDELVQAGIEKFSRAHSPKKRYHMMTTNIAESINSCLLAIRKLPITSIAEFIRDLLQRWFHDRRRNAREMPTFLSHYADQHIKQRVLTSQRCEVHPIDFHRFKVDDKWNKGTIVDLEQHSCSCREWDLDELPCIHVMAVARYAYKIEVSFNVRNLSFIRLSNNIRLFVYFVPV
jgi:hypothetical protein